MVFLMESSFTPIYNRIAIAICKELRMMGHVVHFFDPSAFEIEAFVDTINGVSVDYYISTNDNNYIQQFSVAKGRFVFELIRHQMIFIHHDASFSYPDNIFNLKKKLDALIESQSKISHFFIEDSNIKRFKNIGIERCYKTLHASEFLMPNEVLNFKASSNYNIKETSLNFVGHLVDGFKNYPFPDSAFENIYNELLEKKIKNNNFAVQPELIKFINEDPVRNYWGKNCEEGDLAVFEYLLHDFSRNTMTYRGEIIGSIQNHSIDIYGGDPTYGKNNAPWLKLNKNNITYYPATVDYQVASEIYADYGVSLNISSLQFDSAINNRVVDIISSGGLVLTDYKSDLEIIGLLTNDITFETKDEMQKKLDFYLDPVNQKVTNNLKIELRNEFSKYFTYKKTVSEIIKLATQNT